MLNLAPAVLFVNVTDVTLFVNAAGSKRTGLFTDTSASEKVRVAEKDDVLAVDPVNTLLPLPAPPARHSNLLLALTQVSTKVLLQVKGDFIFFPCN